MQQRIDELRLSAAGCFLGADDGRLDVVRRDRLYGFAPMIGADELRKAPNSFPASCR